MGFQTESSTSAGGASREDLQVLSQHNVSMDIATFKKLQVDALVVSRGGNYRVTRIPEEKGLGVGGVLTFCQVELHEGLVCEAGV